VGQVNRHELTDKQWDVVGPLLPAPSRMGRPPRDAREMLDAMLWVLRTGAPWRDLPDWYGPWITPYVRFRRWRDEGVLDRIVERLQVVLADAGKIDWELWCVDGSSVRAARCAAGAGKKGGRKSPRITH
jgi:transposase